MRNKQRIPDGRPFRFPFDIDRKWFLISAVVFLILSIKPVNTSIFSRINPAHIEKKIVSDFNKRFKDFEKKLPLIKKESISFDAIPEKRIHTLNKKNWYYGVFNNDSLIFWSKSINQGLLTSIDHTDTILPYIHNGEVGLRKAYEISKSPAQTVKLIVNFPLYTEYPLESKLFPSNFSFLHSKSIYAENIGYKLEPIAKNPDADHIISINKTPYFYLDEKSNFINLTDRNFWHFFLSAIPFILFGVSIHTYFKVSVKDNPRLYFSLLVLTAIGIRTLSYFLNFPDDFAEYYIFNPQLYIANELNRSLGDVLINVSLLFWILFFYIMNIQNKILNHKETWKKNLFLIINSVALIISLYISVFTIKSIVFDSQLSFDTTKNENINAETILGLGTILLIFMNYVLIVIIYNRYFEKYTKRSIYKYVAPLMSTFLIFSPWLGEPALWGLATLWTILSLFMLSTKQLNTKFDFNSYKLIYWLIYLSISCVIAIQYFDTQKEVLNMSNLAQRLIGFESIKTKNNLQLLAQQLENDNTINQLNSSNQIKDYIDGKYIAAYRNQYNAHTKITPITGGLSERKTSIELKEEKSFRAYHVKTKTQNFLIDITISPVYTMSSENYAKNLSQPNENIISSDIEYAYYYNKVLINQSGIITFPSKLSNKQLTQNGRIKIVGLQTKNTIIANSGITDNHKTLILAKSKNTVYRVSTTYAYIFTAIFLLMSLYILGNIIARSNLRRKRFINLLGLTLRMRIHLSILLVELISLSVIGIVTILVYTNNTKATAKLKTTIASNEIKNSIEKADIEIKLNSNQDDHWNNFEKIISPYLEKHDVGLNLYSPSGKKVFTTVSSSVATMLPNIVNPQAFYDLQKKKKVSSWQQEIVGNYKYNTIFSKLVHPDGKLYGILEVPDFTAHQTVSQRNSNIITMLINIYAFVFLLSSLFAFYITKRLTSSFSKVINQFSKINLTQTNEPLNWPYSDEIGLLIKEYNRTLIKLENSTALLAKSEREIAWREMARQIAHEIKNPLTPMSLSLQSLQAAIKRNDPNVPDLTNKMTNTVLEQIKVLNRTATNFSEFATMTDIDARKESLLDILESTTGIYSDTEEIEFLFLFPKFDVSLNVDKVKIIRVVTNVIQNAMQSIPEDQLGQIILMATKLPDNYIDITIKDNGIGISEEVRTKIFEPNFTTKSSGSGLGLAMCKDIVAKTGGRIHFESEPGNGTTFHIILPIFIDQEEDEIIFNETEY